MTEYLGIHILETDFTLNISERESAKGIFPPFGELLLTFKWKQARVLQILELKYSQSNSHFRRITSKNQAY